MQVLRAPATRIRVAVMRRVFVRMIISPDRFASIMAHFPDRGKIPSGFYSSPLVQIMDQVYTFIS